MLSGDIQIRWRYGLDDASAVRAVTMATRPEEILANQASRLLINTFATRPLLTVIGEDREQVANAVRDRLAPLLAPTGIEVLAVVIELLHPPADAAPSYHGVQAAVISANTDVARAKADAYLRLAEAQRDQRQAVAKAEGMAGETVFGARADRVRFAADAKAWNEHRDAMAVERWLGAVGRASARAPLTVIDHRLGGSDQGMTVDLRKFAPENP
jgi:regulator of protease activity HflC (stomatin/prohibitin superfamily)